MIDRKNTNNSGQPGLPYTLTQEYLRERVDYHPETGIFVWKYFAMESRYPERWAKKWAGKKAGWKDGNGYNQLTIDNKKYRSSHLAFLYMTGAMPEEEVDHINRDQSDDRWCNLRLATRQQNQRNTMARKKNGLKGAYKNVSGSTWQAIIKMGGKGVHLGTFKTELEAHEAYKKARSELYGDFA